MMGKPTADESILKLKVVNWTITKQQKKSTPTKNECTEKKVLERANKIINRLHFKSISRSTLLQSRNTEWKAANKRIQDHRDLYGTVKKVADKKLTKRVKELEELCKEQNTKLSSYLMKIEKLQEQIIAYENTIDDMVDEAWGTKDQK